MICTQCQEDYPKKFNKDFVDGVCLPCQCQNDAEELQRTWDAELLTYKQRTGIEADYNQFYFMCEQGKVDKKDLVDLPELIIAFDNASEGVASPHTDDLPF